MSESHEQASGKKRRINRKDRRTANDLDAMAAVLESRVQQLRQLACVLRRLSLADGVDVYGAGFWPRGLEEIDKYISGAKSAIAIRATDAVIAMVSEDVTDG